MSHRSATNAYVLCVLALSFASLRCGSEETAESNDNGGYGPPGGVLEIDPGEIPFAGNGGSGGKGGSAGGGSTGRGGASGSGAGAAGGSAGEGGVATAGAAGTGLGGGGSGGSSGAGAGSAGTAGTAGSAGTAGAGGSAGSGGVLSQPSAVFTQTSPLEGLVLLSSNLVQEVYDFDGYQEWFAEVANYSTDEACFVEANVTFRSENSATVTEFHSFVDGAPYDGSITLSISCIPPGQTAAIYANEFGPIVAIDAIRNAHVEFFYNAGSYIPHPAAPLLSAEAVPGVIPERWGIAGVLLGVQTVHNIGVLFYPKDPNSGLIIDQLSAINLGVLAAGQTWNFETSALTPTPFVSFLVSTDFIEGAARELAPASPADSRAMEFAARRSLHTAATRDRRKLAARRGSSSQ